MSGLFLHLPLAFPLGNRYIFLKVSTSFRANENNEPASPKIHSFERI